MSLGPLNRRAVLYSNAPVAGVGGTPVDVLTPVRDLYLTFVEPTHTGGQIVGGRDAEVTTDQFKSRWFPELKDQMFLKVEGRTLRITAHSEIKRRGGWLISTVEVT